MDENAQYLLAIAEHGSISGAASACHLSQPALSKRLCKLESRLGTELFDRTKKPIRPTDAGAIYLEWARSAVRAETRMARRVSDAAQSVSRRLCIGVSVARYTSLLADTVERFYREDEGCTLEFVGCACDDRVNSLLADEKIDFAALIPQRPETALCDVRPMCEERLVYTAPSAWKLEGRDCGGPYPVLSVEEISEHPFVMPDPTIHIASTASAIFDSCQSKPPIVMTCVGIEMCLEAVRRGMGATISTSVSPRFAGEGLSLYEIEGHPGIHDLNYVRLRNRPVSEDERIFVHLLEAWLADCEA